MYLPPATAAEARLVYSHLHVTPAMIRLDRLYDYLYFGSTFLHLIIRIGFLALGLSSSFRDVSDRLADRLLKIGAVQRTQNWISTSISNMAGLNGTYLRAKAWWLKTKMGQFTERFSLLWQPALVRSAFLYYLLYTFVFTVFWFPLSYYEGFVLPHRFGLSHEGLSGWLGDVTRDSTVDALLGAVFAAIIVWGIAIFPKRWSIIFALWSAPVILVGIFLDPVFEQIDNQFTKLPHSSSLYAPLHQLAARAGVPNAEILISNKSKQTEETNAYVTGLGSTSEIVIWDTTISKMKPDEVVAIVGHELGHYVEHHVIYCGIAASLGLFFFFPVLKLMAERIFNLYGAQWKIRSLSDPAAIPVLIVCMSVLTFLLSPVTNAVSRYIEHRADSFGLAVTGNRLAMAQAMVDLTNENLSDPNPPKWETFWLADHPPLDERIRFALFGQPFNGPRERLFKPSP